MSLSLPPDPNLGQLKKQAKELLRAHSDGDSDVCERFRLMHCFADSTDQEILQSEVTLHQAQLALALAYGFRDWRELKEHVESMESRSGVPETQSRQQALLLAGGIADDLYEVLSGIVSYPDLVLLDLPEDSRLRPHMETMQASLQRATAIVHDLLIVTRTGTPITEVVSLNHIILEYLETPEHGRLLSLHPDVKIEANLDPQPLDIVGSPAYLTKAMMNLVSNAAEAMPRGGKISISTESKLAGKSMKKAYGDRDNGDHVVLTVSDRGAAMSPEDMDYVFEPFYTKKVMGRSGSGLGLEALWRIVRDHNGLIDVRSTEEKGTSFEIHFPVSTGS